MTTDQILVRSLIIYDNGTVILRSWFFPVDMNNAILCHIDMFVTQFSHTSNTSRPSQHSLWLKSQT